MPMIACDAGIAFFPIPKVASTTIRHIMYRLIYDRPFAPDDTCKSVYDVPELNARFDWSQRDAFFKFVIIRDPLDRLISAHHYIFPRHFIRKFRGETLPELYTGIDPDPSFEQFILNIDDYIGASRNLAFHIKPYREFVGPSFAKYDAVLPIEDLHRLPDMLFQAKGVTVDIIPFNERPDKEQSGDSARLGAKGLSPAALDAALTFCADDYEICKDYYRPPV